MTDRLRREYLSSVIHQDAEFFERVGPGEVGTRMLKDIGSVRSGVGEKLSILIWRSAKHAKFMKKIINKPCFRAV